MLSACAAIQRGPGAAAASPSSLGLARDIDAILAAPALGRGYWGVLVRSLKSDDTLYELNARKLFIPASNMKIVTVAAAGERLGWDYRFETRLYTSGPVSNGRLDGDLVVVGNGDPSIGTLDQSGDRLFAEWADALKGAGIQTIAGRIIGDDNAFDDVGLGFGWSWDDLPDDYAAAVSALQYNENAVRLTITPGPSAGTFAGVSLSPPTSGLIVDSVVRTSPPGTPPRLSAYRLPGSSRLTLRGTVAAGSAPLVRDVAVDNPTQFFVNALRAGLIANGIDVRGAAVDIDDVRDAPRIAPGAPLASHRSPAVSELSVRLMKISQNLYAETLLEAIGAAAGAPSFAGGREQVVAALQPWGVAAGDLIMRDGSGLSRYDYVTPAALATILTHVSRSDTLRAPFEATLPIAGRDGTLRNQMKGTAAEGNARAKTGSMSNVRSVSGYVSTADGEPLVFSILTNNFDTPAATIDQAQDAIIVRLAAFRR